MIGLAAIASRLPLPAWTAIGAVLLMSVPLGVQTVRLGMVTDSRDEWKAQVMDPGTGYIARLTTCRADVADLSRSLADQNEAVTALEADSAARIAAAEREAEAARQEVADALARAERIIARPIAGDTVCERVQDVHSAFMAELEGEAQ